MDHQVQHDADVGAATGVGGEAVGFDELGAGELGFEGAQGGVEAFDVADLEDEFLFLGDANQFAGLGGVVGNRFFDEEMAAFIKKQGADLVVGAGRGGDGDGFALFSGLFDGGELFDVVLGGDAGPDVGILVVDADEFGIGDLGIDAGVLAADMAHADDSDFQFAHKFGFLVAF